MKSYLLPVARNLEPISTGGNLGRSRAVAYKKILGSDEGFLEVCGPYKKILGLREQAGVFSSPATVVRPWFP